MKKITKLDILSLAVGSIIGWGAFILPGDLFLSKIGIHNSIIGLLVGVIIIIIIEKNYSYLINKKPISGGEYIYTKIYFGEHHSFVCGWFLSLAYVCIVPLNATAIPLIFNILTKNRYLYGYLYSIDNSAVYISDIIISTLFIVLLGYLNIKGIKLASSFQKIMVLLLVGIILIFFSFIIKKEGVITFNIISHYNGINISFENILKIIAISPWAYVGFDCVTQVLEELNFSYKTASKLSIFSLITGFLLYTIIMVLTAYGISYEDLKIGNVSWATGETVEKYFGIVGICFLGFALVSAVICGVNGFYINSTKLLTLMSKEGQLPKILSKNNKNKIPTYSIVFVMILSSFAPWLGREVLVWIVDMSSLGIAIAYLYISLVTIYVYYQENNKIKYSGVLGSVFSLMFILLLVLPVLESSLKKESIYLLMIWILLGLFYKLKNFKNGELKNVSL